MPRKGARFGLALLVLLAIVGGWWLLRRDGPVSEREAVLNARVLRTRAPQTADSSTPTRLDGRSADAEAKPVSAEGGPVEGLRGLVLTIRSDTLDLSTSVVTVQLHADETGVNLPLDKNGVMPGMPPLPAGVRATATSGKVRVVTLEGLPAARYEVSAVASGNPHSRSGLVDVDLVSSASAEATLVIVPRDSEPEIRATVLRAGRPIADADVRTKTGESVEHSYQRATTDAAGMASLRVPPREWVVYLSSYPGLEYLGAPAPVRVTAAAGRIATVQFDLPVHPAVRFRAVGPNGRTVGFSLQLWRVQPDESLAFWNLAGQIRSEVQSPAPLEYFGVLPAGDYMAIASPTETYTPGHLRFSIAEGDPERVIVVRVGDEGVKAALALVRPDGTPAEKVRFNLNRVTSIAEDGIARGAVTDASGKALVTGLRPGIYRLVLWDQRLSRDIEIPLASALRLVMPGPEKGTATLSGRLRYANGDSGLALVYLRRRDEGWAQIVAPNADGVFQAELPPGSWVIEVPFTPWHYGPPFREVRHPVVLRADQAEKVELVLSP